MFKKLRCFIVTANVGSFTKAANELYMTQPAVSQQVTSLERYLGVELFERTSRGLELTAAGRMLAAQASPHMSALERLLAKVSSPADLPTRHLTLLYRGAPDDAVVVPLVRAMARRHPDISVRLERFKESKSKLGELTDGEADAVLFKALEQGAPQGCSYIPLARTRLMVVIAADSALAGACELSLDDLLDEPLNLTEDIGAHALLRPPHGELRYQNVQNELFRRHCAPQLVRFVPDTQCALTFAKAGLGASLVDSAWIRDTAGVACIPLVPPHASSYGLYFAEGGGNPAVAALAELARDLFSDVPFFAPGSRLEPPVGGRVTVTRRQTAASREERIDD